PSVVPAKAGIHKPVAKADSLWIPAFAGTTEILHIPLIFPTQFESRPTMAGRTLAREQATIRTTFPFSA
ncbi:MAG: hypothetical protein P4L91_05930, partial [Burkholderiaceae bacterium]|nr:hypothetical protein [Burkholderiaceae bacterium]